MLILAYIILGLAAIVVCKALAMLAFGEILELVGALSLSIAISWALLLVLR